LRTHTTAHQHELLINGEKQFLIAGPVFRKDEIDRSHYPVFFQLEGLKVLQSGTTTSDALDVLQRMLSGLVKHLFPECEFRILPDKFPFTEPSIQIEVQHNGSWLEVLGAGVVHKEIADRHAHLSGNGNNAPAIACGLGLDRLAMRLFDIHDIRQLWCEESAFLDQFKGGKITKFKPYSTLKPVVHDSSFFIQTDQWIVCVQPSTFGENDVIIVDNPNNHHKDGARKMNFLL
jgi:phenylalanyl-tRNA synthetase alpha chain